MRTSTIACGLWALLMYAGPAAAEEVALPALTAEKADLEQLGEEFKDEQIRFRPPKDLQRVKVELKPELMKLGFYSYAWTPEGIHPSIEVINITCAPPIRGTRETIDDAVAGLHDSLQRGFEGLALGKVRKGALRGTEVRVGDFKGALNGQKVFAVYLMGLDAEGLFSLTASLPEERATEQRVRLLQAALLTFERAKPE
ncbi:MAG TPA: hypothetical protein VF175_19110 [Lacipirellula sp.]